MANNHFRCGTAASLSSLNPKLVVGEMGLETDTGKFKIGDGATAWNSLKYFINADDVSSAVNEAIEGYIAVDDLKTLAAAAATYADFQTAIAAL